MFHTFDFPEFQREGVDETPLRFSLIQMPKDLTGWTVLDIGAWDGYYSFMAEKRGALRVLATDSYKWQEEFKITHPELIPTFPDPKRKVFDEVRKALNSKVEFKEIELMDLDKLGKFDLVLCLGILYHVKDPWAIINHLGKITKKMLIIETHTDGNAGGDLHPLIDKPLMVFYPNGWKKDYSTYWGMNISCIAEMLKQAGFKDIKLINYGSNHRAIFQAFK